MSRHRSLPFGVKRLGGARNRTAEPLFRLTNQICSSIMKESQVESSIGGERTWAWWPVAHAVRLQWRGLLLDPTYTFGPCQASQSVSYGSGRFWSNPCAIVGRSVRQRIQLCR